MTGTLDVIFCYLVVFGLLCSTLYLMIIIARFVYHAIIWAMDKIRRD